MIRVEAIGLKLLDGTWSLNGRVDYLPTISGGGWQTIPGNGAYVAHCCGLWSSPDNPATPRYVVMECADEVLGSPAGVRCWRHVRWVRDARAEDLIPLARQEPVMALIYAAEHLADVLPTDVWIGLCRREPWAAVNYASKRLHDIPQHVWSELERLAQRTR